MDLIPKKTTQVALRFIRTVFILDQEWNLREAYEVTPGIFSYSRRSGAIRFELALDEHMFETALEGLYFMLRAKQATRKSMLGKINREIREIEEKIRNCGGTIRRPMPRAIPTDINFYEQNSDPT